MRHLLLALSLCSVSAAASAMPNSTFLQKTNALKAKGPLAAFLGDVGLLKRQVRQDGEQLEAENKALEAAGKRKHYCAPEGSALALKGLMAAVNAVPSGRAVAYVDQGRVPQLHRAAPSLPQLTVSVIQRRSRFKY